MGGQPIILKTVISPLGGGRDTALTHLQPTSAPDQGDGGPPQAPQEPRLCIQVIVYYTQRATPHGGPHQIIWKYPAWTSLSDSDSKSPRNRQVVSTRFFGDLVYFEASHRAAYEGWGTPGVCDSSRRLKIDHNPPTPNFKTINPILSTEGRGVRLCWEKSKPIGPQEIDP